MRSKKVDSFEVASNVSSLICLIILKHMMSSGWRKFTRSENRLTFALIKIDRLLIRRQQKVIAYSVRYREEELLLFADWCRREQGKAKRSILRHAIVEEKNVQRVKIYLDLMPGGEHSSLDILNHEFRLIDRDGDRSESLNIDVLS